MSQLDTAPPGAVDPVTAPGERMPVPVATPTFPLDTEVRASQTASRRAPYGRAAFLAVAGVVALEIVLTIVGGELPLGGTGRDALGFVGEGLIGVIAFTAAWPLARHEGGWRRALGLDRPRRGDVKTTATWFGLQVATRLGVVYALIICVPPLRHQHVSNLTALRHPSVAGVVLIALAVVVLAPIAEETMMRGIVLRASMRRLAFWPAAIVNAAIFGALHAHEGGTALAAMVLAVSTGAFGLVQCILVRRHGRITPAIGVHATTNLLVLALALLTAY